MRLRILKERGHEPVRFETVSLDVRPESLIGALAQAVNKRDDWTLEQARSIHAIATVVWDKATAQARHSLEYKKPREPICLPEEEP